MRRNCIARALYDNASETPEELAFRKGDILTVLEQNTNGLQGWWLCALRGLQGIVPGNRLQLIPTLYDPTGLGFANGIPATQNGFRTTPVASLTFEGNSLPHSRPASTIGEPSSNMHSITRRASWRGPGDGSKVVIPVRVGDVFEYDTLPSAANRFSPGNMRPSSGPARTSRDISSLSGEMYDSPVSSKGLAPRRQNMSFDSAFSPPHSPWQTYDEPRGSAQFCYDTPRNRFAATQAQYDVPRIASTTTSHNTTTTNSLPEYDVPTISRGNPPLCEYDVPRAEQYDVPRNAPSSLLREYDVPRNDILREYDVPHTNPAFRGATTDTYDVPQTRDSHLKELASGLYDVPLGRDTLDGHSSSGVSSCASNSPPLAPSSTSATLPLSPASSHSSLNTSVSLSSFSAPSSSNRSSLEQPSLEGAASMGGVTYDFPPMNGRRAQVTVSPLAASVCSVPRLPNDNQSTVRAAPVAPPVSGVATVADASSLASYDNTSIGVLARRPSPVCGSAIEISEKRCSSSSDESRDYAPIGPTFKMLELSADDALRILDQLQKKVDVSLENFLACTGTLKKRSPAVSLQSSCESLRCTIGEFLEFTQGTVANAESTLAVSTDRKLFLKLRRLVSTLSDSGAVITSCVSALRAQQWSPVPPKGSPDPLERMTCCVRALPHDILQAALCIRSNVDVLFAPGGGNANRKIITDRPPSADSMTSLNLTNESAALDSSSYREDDYVHLHSEETAAKIEACVRATLPEGMSATYERLLNESRVMMRQQVGAAPPHVASAGDATLIQYYLPHLEKQMTFLADSIDAFLVTVERSQPPRVFVEHIKFILVGAHKMAYIGDALQRTLSEASHAAQMRTACATLCAALRQLVNVTRRAATHFPSVAAVQDMVDQALRISHLARDLRTCVAVHSMTLTHGDDDVTNASQGHATAQGHEDDSLKGGVKSVRFLAGSETDSTKTTTTITSVTLTS